MTFEHNIKITHQRPNHFLYNLKLKFIYILKKGYKPNTYSYNSFSVAPTTHKTKSANTPLGSIIYKICFINIVVFLSAQKY